MVIYFCVSIGPYLQCETMKRHLLTAGGVSFSGQAAGHRPRKLRLTLGPTSEAIALTTRTGCRWSDVKRDRALKSAPIISGLPRHQQHKIAALKISLLRRLRYGFHLSFAGTVQRIYAPQGWRVEFEPIALQGRTGVKWTAVSEGGGVAPGQRVGGFSVRVLGSEAGFACGRGLSFGFRKGQGGGGVFQGCVS